MDFVTSTVAGVVGGLIATGMWAVLRQFYLKVVDPWYEETVYKDAHVEGRWKARYTIDGVSREVVGDIRRVGHAIKGMATEIVGPHPGRNYAFTGTFRNLILTASYVSVDKHTLERGAMTLMLIENGEKLRRHMSYYAEREHCVGSIECEWVRHSGSAPAGVPPVDAAQSV
jgi:hypothetical protein